MGRQHRTCRGAWLVRNSTYAGLGTDSGAPRDRALRDRLARLRATRQAPHLVLLLHPARWTVQGASGVHRCPMLVNPPLCGRLSGEVGHGDWRGVGNCDLNLEGAVLASDQPIG